MEQMQFKISSALKDLVGKDLIINDNVAIFELVKNAYDAYAKKVLIEFYDDKIIIADNGKGMSLNDIKNKHSDENVLIVSHSSIIRCLHNVVNDQVEEPDDIEIGNGYFEIIDL